MSKVKDIFVLDIETQKSFDEVGGRQNLDRLGVSVVGVYSYNRDQFLIFEEKEIKGLVKLFKEAKLVVGFNTKNFDYPVLNPLLPFDMRVLPSLDIMNEIEQKLGHRVALNDIALSTLGVQKSGNGLQAIALYRAGNIEQLKRYCLDDVRITRDIYEYGKQNNRIFYSTYVGKEPIPVYWKLKGTESQWPEQIFDDFIFGEKDLKRILKEAHDKKRPVEILYESRQSIPGEPFLKRRKIEILYFDGFNLEAYCHLRKDTRNFRIDRIAGVKIV